MTSESPESGPTLDQLDALPTEELRERAFRLAWERRDLKWFVHILGHLPHADDVEGLDGSLGSYGASLADVVSLWREFTGHGFGESEPLLRAAFIDYLLAEPAG